MLAMNPQALQAQTSPQRDGAVPPHTVLGAAHGPVVVVLDGTRAGGLGDEAHVAAVRAGVRLVVPHLASDLRVLVDALELDEIGLLAGGAGVPLALGAVTVLGRRVRAVSLIGEPPPHAFTPLDLPLTVWNPERGPSLATYDAALRFAAPS
jgi:hypothetical protein